MKNGDEWLTPKDIIKGIGAFILLLLGGSIFKLMLDFLQETFQKTGKNYLTEWSLIYATLKLSYI